MFKRTRLIVTPKAEEVIKKTYAFKVGFIINTFLKGHGMTRYKKPSYTTVMGSYKNNEEVIIHRWNNGLECYWAKKSKIMVYQIKGENASMAISHSFYVL